MDKKAICIIPARGGSKRIPNKNIRKINNKPMITHVIRNLKKSKCFEDIFVSTDSKKIKNIVEKNGAKVPFLRSKKLSNDFTPIHKVILDAIIRLKTKYDFSIICYIFPTSIFISDKLIKKYFKIFKKSNKDFFLVLKKFDHPIERALKINNKKLKPVKEKNFTSRTQKFKSHYYDSGLIYFGRKNAFKKKKYIFDNKIEYFISNDKIVDIDTKEDLIETKKLFR